MVTYVAAVILLAYVSLLMELTVFHVPSVASSLNLYAQPEALVESYSTRYRQLFRLSKALKTVLFLVPLLLVYAVYAYPIFVIWLGPDLLGDYLYSPVFATNVAGISLIVVGRVLAIETVLTIRRNNDQTGESFYLHTTGLLRWSRNPGLVGMYLFAIGLWLTTPSFSMLIGIVLYALYMHFKVRMEEDFLHNKFGRQYADYRAKTGRYLP
jgi:protein-S-isoprenylcysteine O-methyltransferase Ste14